MKKEERRRKKENGVVLLCFAHSILTGRLPADIHPLELTSWGTMTLLLQPTFIFSSSFFLYAQEKGPKRTAPLGAGPVFP